MVFINFQYLTDCSLCMIVCLAEENRLMSSRELETKINFPQNSIFTAGRKLKKHGFISTVSGPFGGYKLAKPANQITVQEILTAYKDGFNISNELTSKENTLPVLLKYAKLLTKIKNDIDQKFSFTLVDLLEAE